MRPGLIENIWEGWNKTYWLQDGWFAICQYTNLPNWLLLPEHCVASNSWIQSWKSINTSYSQAKSFSKCLWFIIPRIWCVCPHVGITKGWGWTCRAQPTQLLCKDPCTQISTTQKSTEMSVFAIFLSPFTLLKSNIGKWELVTHNDLFIQSH